jgi:hypothetical protein
MKENVKDSMEFGDLSWEIVFSRPFAPNSEPITPNYFGDG